MNVSDFEKYAWEGKPPKGMSPEGLVLYSIARAMYADYKEDKISKEEAQNRKQTALFYFDAIQGLARANSRIIHQLSISLAPRKDLVKRDKKALLEVISRIEGLASGLMRDFKSKVPEFFRFKEE